MADVDKVNVVEVLMVVKVAEVEAVQEAVVELYLINLI